MAVFPVSIFVFIIGFSAGVAQVGIASGSIKYKFRVSDERFRDLRGFLNELDVKISYLIDGLKGGIDLNHVDVIKIKKYLAGLEGLRTTLVQAKKIVEGSIASDIPKGNMGSDWEGGKKSTPKLNRKRKDLGASNFDFVQFLSTQFQDNLLGLKAPKAKEATKGEFIEQSNSMVKDSPVEESVSVNEIKERSSKRLPGCNEEKSKIKESDLLSNKNLQALEGNAADKVKAVNIVLKNGNSLQSKADAMNVKKSYIPADGYYGNDMLSYDEELNNLNRSFRITTKQGSFSKMVFKHNYEGRFLQSDNSNQRTARSMDYFTSESDTSLLLEQALENSNKSYNPSHRSKSSKLKVEQTNGTKDMTVRSEEQSVLGHQQPINGDEEGSVLSSSTSSVDEEFSKNVKEATDLLKRARKCMMSQVDEETVDTILRNSARLLSAAVAMRPMSLLAVGQLGNSYLLHGELKLKISRELRTLLLRSDEFLNGKGRVMRVKNLDTRALSRDDVASVLIEVCEECEELLVEAGRKYRMALSIDGNDVRALYNWGLALSLRAQLIADIGPEAAFDADKVYLAAIDKFDAMMSRSKVYAPDALYRWGVALQQRSHLRTRNSREKMKLLQQAKSLFEDILSVESDNHHVREALVSCISELNHNGQW